MLDVSNTIERSRPRQHQSPLRKLSVRQISLGSTSRKEQNQNSHYVVCYGRPIPEVCRFLGSQTNIATAGYCSMRGLPYMRFSAAAKSGVPMSGSLNLGAYFERINWGGGTNPTFETLAGLFCAPVSLIPF